MECGSHDLDTNRGLLRFHLRDRRSKTLGFGVLASHRKRSGHRTDDSISQEEEEVKVLVACEFSGVVRDVFRAKGHEAWSCDLLPSDSPYHIQGDVIPVISTGWDMMIAFPPCTHLAVSGARWFKDKEEEQVKAITFFLRLATAPIERICIENPVGVMSRYHRKPDQIIQPWQFGHPESKKTCLWLKNLPKLVPTDVLPPRKVWENQTPSGQNKLGPSEDRWKLRSITYKGIAQAMADQWG